MGHPTKIGDLVGRSSARVVAIRASDIVVHEEHRDPVDDELLVEEHRLELATAVSDDPTSSAPSRPR